MNRAAFPPLIVLPAAVFLLALLAYPLAQTALISLSQNRPGTNIAPALTLENYARFLGDPYYRGVLWTTLRISLLTTLSCLLLGYPFAYWTSRQRGWLRAVLLFAALAPLMVSVAIRTLGWIVILADNGPINALLLSLGAVSRPVRMIYNEFAVVVGLTEALLPFMILSVVTSLQSVPSDVLRAAAIAGASPGHAFFRITLPLTLPGIAAGSLLVFALAASSFVTPRVLGGGRTMTVANLVVDQFLVTLNWPFGAAIGLMLLAVALGVLGLQHALTRQAGRPAA